MKPKLILLISITLSCLGIAKSSAQSLSVKSKDGTEQSVDLSSVQKLTFSNGNLNVSKKTGATQTYALPTVDKVYFNGIVTGLSPWNNSVQGAADIYFIASENMVYIGNVPNNNCLVSIFNARGAIVYQKTVNAGNQTANVSHLPAGIYILKANNLVLKFIKR